MALAVVLTFAAVALFIAVFQVRYRFSLVAATHLILFWLDMFIYELVSLYLHPRFTDESVEVVVCFLLLSYMVLFRAGAALCIRAGAVKDVLISFAEQVPARTIALYALVWLMVKAYLVRRYGPLAAFQTSTAVGKALGVSYPDEVLSSLAMYPAVGSVFIYIIQLGSNPRALTTPLGAIMLPLAAILMFTGEVEGARRFLFLLCVLFALTFSSKRRFQITAKTLGAGLGLALLAVALAGYYQRVRFNAGSVFTGALQRPLSTFSYTELAEGLFTPFPDRSKAAGNISALRENLEARGTPFGVLYKITQVELDDYSRLTEGRLLLQTLKNSTPRFLFEGKKYLDPDEILSETYKFPHEDLATSFFAEFQAEFHFAGYIVVPVVYLSLIILYLLLLNTNVARISIMGPSIVFCMVSLAGNVEQALEKPVDDIRNLLGLFLIGGLVHLLWLAIKSVRRGPANFGYRPAWDADHR